MTFLRYAVLLCLLSAPAFGASYTWSGKGGSHEWSNPLNWLPTNGPPASGDSVTIGADVELDSGLSLANVNISQSTLSGTGSLTVTAQSSFTYVTFTLASVTVNAPTDIYPAGGAYVETTVQCPFINNSTITMHGNAEFVVNPGIQVMNKGTWNFSPQTTLSVGQQPGQATFVNSGSMYFTNATVSSAGTGSMLSNASGGLIFSVQTNTFNGFFASAGTIETATNSLLLIANDSTFYLYAGAAITGAGTTLVNCSAFVNGNVLVTGGFQFLTDGTGSSTTITINGLLEIGNNGLFNWYGGGLVGVGTNVTGAVQVNSQGSLYIVNDANGMSLKNVILTNNGFVYWTNNGTLYLANNALIVNQHTFYISGDSALGQLQGDTSVVGFTNTGLVVKNVGATNYATTAIKVPFYDAGSVEISQGNFELYNGGSFNNWTANAGATITFEAGTFTAQPSSSFTSGGPITLLSSASLNIPQYALLFIQANFFQSGGGIFGGGKITVVGGLNQGIYQWNAGTISITNQSAAVFIEQGGVMNIEGANNTKNLFWGILLNYGVINWTNDNSSGGINLSNQAGIANWALFNLQCDAFMNDVSAASNSAPVFYNAEGSLLAKTANAGTSTIGVRFLDAGTVRAQSGTIEFASFADNYPNPPLATIMLAGGKVQFDANPIVHANIGGTGQIISQKGLDLSGGTLTVVAITISGNATNDETFDLSSFGTLTLNGNFTQTPKGVVIIPVQNTNSGGYGKITSSGSVTLGGTLDAPLAYGGAPAIGASFPFLTCSTLFNTFSTVLVPEGMTVHYTGSSASIVVTNTTAVVIGSLLTVTNQLEFGFATVSNDFYTIQYTTNLPPVQWMELTNFIATTTNELLTVPMQTNTLEFFRVGHSTPR